MSKIKNTPEFQRMMDEQELMASFHFAEQELEKDQLMKDLQAETALADAVAEYRKAQEDFMLAQVRFSNSLKAYREYKESPDESVEKLSDSMDMLRNMFEGFNPNH